MKKTIISLFFVLLLTITGFAQKPTETTRRAAKHLNANDIDGAIKILNEGISNNKDLLESYKMRAFLHQMKGNLSESVADLNEAIKIEPTDASLYARRGDVKSMMRDKSAIKDFNWAIANGHETDQVYTSRAMFYRSEGDLDKAEADYRTAYSINSESANTVIGLASILDQRGNIAEAITVLEGFTNNYETVNDDKLPTNSSTVISSRDVVISKKTDDKNRKIITGATVEARDHKGVDVKKTQFTLGLANAYSYLAMVLTKNNQLDEALSSIQKSLKIDSNSGYAVGIRGKVYMEKGDFDNALDDFNISIRLMPRLPNHYIDRGIIYLIKGNKAKAQADFDKFLEFNPTLQNVIDERIAAAKMKYNF